MRGSGILAALGIALAAAAASAAAPAPARVAPVRDTYFGTEVVDPYRWMEDAGSAELAAFLAAQGAHTRATLDALGAPRRELHARIRELQGGTAAIRFVNQAGDRYYYLETAVDAKAARLVSRDVRGGDRRVLLEPSRFDKPGASASIDFLAPAPRGRHVAVAVSWAGAEDWVLRVVDTRDGRLLDDAVADIGDPFPRWAADGQGFYYSRLQPLAPGAPETTRYDNVRVHFHALGSDPRRDPAVFGPGVVAGIDLPVSSGFPQVDASADGRWLVARHVQGTDYASPAIWVRELEAREPRWRQVATHADRVSSVRVRDGRAYVLCSRDAANGRVLSIELRKGTLADAEVVLPEGDVIVSADTGELVLAADALYVIGQRAGLGVIRRIDTGRGGKIAELALPLAGSITDADADPALPGLVFGMESPTVSPRLYRYDPAGGKVVDTGVRAADPADYSRVEVRRVEFDGTDGARVPLTIVAPRGLALDGSHPLLLAAYGAYGAIAPVGWNAPYLAWYERGGVYAFVHARGGGEKGAAWHEAGRKTRKQHTIDDVVGAARWLIAQGYTSPSRLAVAGKSAGGIAAGGAFTQQPGLFRAALLRVGVTDLLRIERSSGGEANTAEYGSVRNPDEFRVLHSISPYARVRDGVAYPAVLLETGIHDPRVPPWQLAKMAARLQAASASGHPVLLRVDYAAGHGLGNDKLQVAELLADEFAFLGWQLGLRGFAAGPAAADGAR